MVTDAVDFPTTCCCCCAAATTVGDNGIISMASRLSVVMPMSESTDLISADGDGEDEPLVGEIRCGCCGNVAVAVVVDADDDEDVDEDVVVDDVSRW